MLGDAGKGEKAIRTRFEAVASKMRRKKNAKKKQVSNPTEWGGGNMRTNKGKTKNTAK